MRNDLKYKILLVMFAVLGCAVLVSATSLQRLQLTDSLKIADVWSGHPVDFAFVQRGDSQYVAYYDTARRMTVAVRPVLSKTVRTLNLPSTIGWDSHNYIALALDSLGLIHVSGNMHNVPLIYFRSTVPYTIDSLKPATMVGTLENSVTYPVFFNGPANELLFMYRDGGSGNGNQIFNKWNMSARRWTRLFDRPLFDGQGQRNAYMGGPLLGPDGYFHVYWMWRETADAATTHDVGHIKSRDLLNWETAAGTRVTLPVTATTPGVLVDTIPQRSGLINRGAIGFDAQKRVIVTYHKFDASGYTQLYNARYEGTYWKKYQASNWAYRWNFGGTGSLVMQITFGPVMLEPSGVLTQAYTHVQYGTGIWQLSEAALQQQANLGTSLWPAALEQPRRNGMVVHWLKSTGLISMAGTFLNSTSTLPKDPSIVYALRWETMPENQDQPRTPIPAPTPLMLYTFKDPNVVTRVLHESGNTHHTEFQGIRSANSVALIRNSGTAPVTITVFDLSGRIVRCHTVRSITPIDIRQWVGKGTFILIANISEKRVYSGIVVNILPPGPRKDSLL